MRFRHAYIEEACKTNTARRNFERMIEESQAGDVEAGREERSVEQILADRNGVDLPPGLTLDAHRALNAVPEIGRDANGRMLMSDKRAWLDEMGVDDECERRGLLFLWRVIEAERALIREEQREDS